MLPRAWPGRAAKAWAPEATELCLGGAKAWALEAAGGPGGAESLVGQPEPLRAWLGRAPATWALAPSRPAWQAPRAGVSAWRGWLEVMQKPWARRRWRSLGSGERTGAEVAGRHRPVRLEDAPLCIGLHGRATDEPFAQLRDFGRKLRGFLLRGLFRDMLVRTAPGNER